MILYRVYDSLVSLLLVLYNVQVIQEHLESEQGLPNLTDDDIQQVLDLIKKWQSLEKVRY